MVSICEHKFAQSETVWIFGKGPSLEAFDATQATGTNICINESLLLVENPTYFFTHDEAPIRNVAGALPANCYAILEKERAGFAIELGIPESQIITYEKQLLGEELEFDSDDLLSEGKLIGKSGTVHSALHFCKLLGTQTINMVGFDGKGDYASKLGMEMPVGGGQHSRIRNDSKRLLSFLGFRFRFIDDLLKD